MFVENFLTDAAIYRTKVHAYLLDRVRTKSWFCVIHVFLNRCLTGYFQLFKKNVLFMLITHQISSGVFNKQKKGDN